MRMTILLGFCTLGAFPVIAGAQQAAMPTPPKTVNPLPQPTTGCRGCSDSNSQPTPTTGSYDEKKTGTVRPDVKPNIATKRVVAKKHHPRKRTHRRVAAKARSATAKAAVIKVLPDSTKK